MMNGHQLEMVNTFKYLGSSICSDGKCKAELKIRLDMALASLSRLTVIWKSNISVGVKVKLYKSLVLSVVLYGCESWTLTADMERRLQAFEYKCYRRILRISYRQHKTNLYVRNKIEMYAGVQEPLLSLVKRRKLAWFGHVCRHDSLSKTILQGKVEGGRSRGGQIKAWTDNIKEWTGQDFSSLIRIAEDRNHWRTLCAEVSNVVPLRP